MSYFKIELKRRKEEFFNMENELNQFIRSLKDNKLIVVSGLRRYGKTSLILTGLNEAKADYIFIDCRLLPSGMISLRDFFSLLEGA